MTSQTLDNKNWRLKLTRYALECRISRPIPFRESLSLPQIQQMEIIRRSLLNWIAIFSSSAASGFSEKTAREITMVFTSSAPGLVAAEEFARKGSHSFISLFPDEFGCFLQSFPDREYQHHAHVWSHFIETVERETLNFAEQFHPESNETYWLQVEGIMHGPQFGRGLEHLWSWNGSRTKLLRKNFRHWAS